MRPADLGRQFVEDVDALDAAAEEVQPKISEDVQKRLRAVMEVFEDIARGSSEVTPEDGNQLLEVLISADVLARLVASLGALEFEVRKDVTSAFSLLLRLEKPEAASARVVEYLIGHDSFLQTLLDGYSRPEEALHCGIILRACVRHASVVEALLGTGHFHVLVRCAQTSSFDVAADAFASLKTLLMVHAEVSARYIGLHFDEFFELYNGLLRSEDYVTLRQSLKLLSEILLSRSFMQVMLRYVNDAGFLQIHMNLLRDKSKTIQFEAFHIFKVFAANPQKSANVHQILYQNKDKLVRFLEAFHTDRQDDEQFVQDRATVIEKLKAMEKNSPRDPSRSETAKSET